MVQYNIIIHYKMSYIDIRCNATPYSMFKLFSIGSNALKYDTELYDTIRSYIA